MTHLVDGKCECEEGGAGVWGDGVLDSNSGLSRPKANALCLNWVLFLINEAGGTQEECRPKNCGKFPGIYGIDPGLQPRKFAVAGPYHEPKGI